MGFVHRPIIDVEDLDMYREEGYHPVSIGDKLRDRYQIVDKLGYGGFSTVWLARDTHAQRYVALKIGISGSDASFHESQIIRALSSPGTTLSPESGKNCVPQILDEFDIYGPNGKHHCYTKTVARCSIGEVTINSVFPLQVARALAGKLALAVAYIHSQGYVHGDLHLRNILVEMPSSIDTLSIDEFYKKYGQPETAPVVRLDGLALGPGVPAQGVVPIHLGKSAKDFTMSDTRLLLGDFGEAYSPVKGDIRLGEDCHSPTNVRPPETRLEPKSPMSFPADIWMFGLAMWKLIALKPLISDDFPTDDEVIAQHIDIIGPLPPAWQTSWAVEYSRYFDETGKRRDSAESLWPCLDVAFENGGQKLRIKKNEEPLGDEEKVAFLDLVRKILVFKPEGRLTAQQVLESEWMVNWALPEVQRS